ncbi:MAG: hypothetical protein ACXABY_00910 [Candidatus Thorarchaeota archaeon]|jgi:hypothetical protein
MKVTDVQCPDHGGDEWGSFDPALFSIVKPIEKSIMAFLCSECGLWKYGYAKGVTPEAHAEWMDKWASVTTTHEDNRVKVTGEPEGGWPKGPPPGHGEWKPAREWREYEV